MKKYELKNNKALGRYEFDLGGATAVVDYEECGPGCIAVTHTGVPDRFCGQGIASQLTVAVLEDLKRQGLKVVPLCRFMARYILRHPEWKQMVADKWRVGRRYTVCAWRFVFGQGSFSSGPCRPFFGYKARGLLPDGEWAETRIDECRLPGF